MSKAAPRFERISLADLKARLPLEELSKLDGRKDAGGEPVNGSGRRRPKDQPGTNGNKRKGASRKSG
jgi:hypothetical protein